MKNILALILICGALVFLTGCATTDDQPKEQARVNQLPWDRPEAWESQGPMGAFAPQMNTH